MERLYISHWSLVIGKQRTKDEGVPEPVEGQKRRLGGGNETQHLLCW